jgi:hypothetical protein
MLKNSAKLYAPMTSKYKDAAAIFTFPVVMVIWAVGSYQF